MALREGLIIIGNYEIMKLFKKIFCLVVFVFVAIADVYGQIYTVNGTVTDVSNGARLLGASVYIEGTVNGTASDEFGNYEFRQEQGKYRLVCTFIGYDTAFKNIDLKSDMRIDISLTPLTTMMSSVEVAERREDRNVRSTEVGTIDIPHSFYTINGNLYIDYGDHNAWRMPNYHRLDLSATWNAFNRKHVAGNLNFSIYNVYNRKNPYMVSYSMLQDENTNKLEIKAFQISLFPILPSVSLNLTFK